MKAYLICAFFCTIGFFAMGMQLGLFGNQQTETYDDEPKVVVEEKKSLPKRAKFPEELAPAARTQPVPIAAAFVVSNQPHKMVFMKPNGALHPWHEDHYGYHEDWHTERVEETELIVVVGNATKHQVEVIPYGNNAPPITRYRYQLDASLIEAKTGNVLTYRSFHNLPRHARPREAWDLTAIGAPVTYHTVFRWAADIAKFGPPPTPIATPIVVNVKD